MSITKKKSSTSLQTILLAIINLFQIPRPTSVTPTTNYFSHIYTGPLFPISPPFPPPQNMNVSLTLKKNLSPPLCSGAGSKASSPFPGSTDADIIELQDLRLSPLPSIRNRSGLMSGATTPGTTAGITGVAGAACSHHQLPHDPAKFPPSFRIARAPGYNTHAKSPGLRYRGARQHRPKVSARERDGNEVEMHDGVIF